MAVVDNGWLAVGLTAAMFFWRLTQRRLERRRAQAEEEASTQRLLVEDAEAEAREKAAQDEQYARDEEEREYRRIVVERLDAVARGLAALDARLTADEARAKKGRGGGKDE